MLKQRLLEAGDIERNPGPVKRPCHECKRAAARGRSELCCVECSNLYHIKCSNMTSRQFALMSTYDKSQWLCSICKCSIL